VAAVTTGTALERQQGEQPTELRRAIGPKFLTVFIVGDILRAGIYALVGEVGAEVGVVPTDGLSGSDAPLLEVVEPARSESREPVEHEHFHAPSIFPILGALISVALLVDTALHDASVFLRAAILLAVGAALWVANRLVGGPPEAALDAERLRAG
jgi:hypothetical protein